MATFQKTSKTWSNKNVNYLRENIGRKSIKEIAKVLNRTESAVINKIKRLGIENTKDEYGLTASGLARIIGVDSRIVLNWAYNHELKHHKHAPKGKRNFVFIHTHDFWAWAERNKNLINFSKIPKNALPPEPEWVEIARRKDYYDGHVKKRKATQWTTQEINQLKKLLETNMNYQEIADKLNRSRDSVYGKIRQLPKYKRKSRRNTHTKNKELL